MAPGDIIVKANLVTSNMWDEMNKAAPFAPLKLKGLICKMIVIEEDSVLFFPKVMLVIFIIYIYIYL